jgi:hypothetical protein
MAVVLGYAAIGLHDQPHIHPTETALISMISIPASGANAR